MRIKYCNNCKSWQESWAEHCKDSKYSDNQCWKCDKYELTSKVVVVPDSSSLSKEENLRSINEGGYQIQSCGDICTTETLTFDKSVGAYSYDKDTTSEGIRRRQQLQMVQLSRSENVIICTKDLQTTSNVEYKRPSSPCRIS